MTDLDGRLLNFVVLTTLVLAGVGYSRLLWSLNLRPTAILVTAAILPGAIFLTTIWAIRAAQGTPSLIWPILLIDYFVFSGTAVVTVLIARRRHR